MGVSNSPPPEDLHHDTRTHAVCQTHPLVSPTAHAHRKLTFFRWKRRVSHLEVFHREYWFVIQEGERLFGAHSHCDFMKGGTQGFPRREVSEKQKVLFKDVSPSTAFSIRQHINIDLILLYRSRVSNVATGKLIWRLGFSFGQYSIRLG